MKTISYYRGQAAGDLSIELIVPKFNTVSKRAGLYEIYLKVTGPDGVAQAIRDEFEVRIIEPFKVKVKEI